MQEYFENEVLRSQPLRLISSSLELAAGIIITPLLLIYLELGLVCSQMYHFVEYKPVNCFEDFVQSNVEACRQPEKNPNSSVVAKL